MDDTWRKKNAQIVAEIIRVPTDLVRVETESPELAVAGVAAAVEEAEVAMAEVILIASQQISPVMHR